MNLRGTFFTVSSLAMIALVFGAEAFFYMSVKTLPEKYGLKATEEKSDPYKLVKAFHFFSGDSLDEWEEKVLSGKRTDYTVGENEGKNCVRAYSVNSASALYYKERFPYNGDPVLSWDWKAEKFPAHKEQETLGSKPEFDFVAQVYVVFYARFFLNSRGIQYVWTETVPAGTAADSPYTENVKLLVLESGPAEGWKREERDIRKDYLELFGEPLDREISVIAFMTDADSTGSEACAYYSNIMLAYRGEGGREPLSDRLKRIWRSWVTKLSGAKISDI